MSEAADSATSEVYRAYLAAVCDGDRRRAFAVVDAAREAGLPAGTLYVEVFQPALREIGRLWQENRISVADEHLATAITQAAMSRLFGEIFAGAPRPDRVLVAACADTERHEVGLRMLCDLLELAGWDTIYLGTTVPVDGLLDMVRKRAPDAVALSTALGAHLPRLRAMIDGVRALRDERGGAGPLILVGGRPFVDDPDLALSLGADLTARDARDAVALLEARLPSRAAAP